MEHKFTIVVIAAVLTSLLLAGTILAPIQSYAAGSRGGFPDTSSLKHAIRDGVNVNLEHRDQHMNQENLCYRDNTCRQSDVGQNTLGNDNSITGFADQSDNIQQSAAAPLTPPTANQTTASPSPTPSPTPNPTTGTLTVIKRLSSGDTPPVKISDFVIHVTGNNPTPANFNASSTGTDVTLGPGTFSVTEAPSAVFNPSFSSECSGTIAAGQHLTCTITNTPKPCAECFTSRLTPEQVSNVIGNVTETTLAELCTHIETGIISESGLTRILVNDSGIDVTTANEVIACLKAAGIVFRP
jgi:Zn finger protein HypA/HybF involved in hydrogenase expression